MTDTILEEGTKSKKGTKLVTKYGTLFNHNGHNYTLEEIAENIKLPKNLLQFQFTVNDDTTDFSFVKTINCGTFASDLQAFKAAVWCINKEISESTNLYPMRVNNFICIDYKNKIYSMPEPIVVKQRIRVKTDNLLYD